MAVRPEISLNPLVPSVQPVFQGILEGIEGRRERERQEQERVAGQRRAALENQLLGARVEETQAGAEQQRELNRIQSISIGASEILPDLNTGNVDAVRSNLLQRRVRLQEQGLPTNDTDEGLALLDQEGGVDRLRQISENAIQLGQRFGVVEGLAGERGVASAKTEILDDGTTIQSLPSGETQVRNPQGQVVTGQERLDTLQRSQQFRISAQEEEADIAVSKARRIAAATQREQRVSAVKQELSTRNRSAARESVRLNQALKIAGEAEQGLTGAVKLKLAKIIPNVDVSDEAVLAQSLTQLALDHLQNFKGPTTDFEFGVTESIVGRISDPRTANIARLKSLQRANFFNKKEFDQFNRHIKSGGDPDTFSFNFGEPVKTKKGVFTLQDIQDTAVSNNLSIEETIKRLNQ
jgi:hypothetical protein